MICKLLQPTISLTAEIGVLGCLEPLIIVSLKQNLLSFMPSIECKYITV